jgi:hypothetical protein
VAVVVSYVVAIWIKPSEPEPEPAAASPAAPQPAAATSG